MLKNAQDFRSRCFIYKWVELFLCWVKVQKNCLRKYFFGQIKIKPCHVIASAINTQFHIFSQFQKKIFKSCYRNNNNDMQKKCFQTSLSNQQYKYCLAMFTNLNCNHIQILLVKLNRFYIKILQKNSFRLQF